MEPDRRRYLAHAAALHIRSAIEDIRDAAREVEAQTGEQILASDPRPITDATRDDLLGAKEALSVMVLAVEHALQWVGPNMTLGMVLKTMPTDAAESLSGALRDAGMLSAT